MSGRAAMLGMGAAAGPPPSGDTFGDTGLNAGGSEIRLTSWTPIPFDGHSGAFAWLEAGDTVSFWAADPNNTGFRARGGTGSGQVTYCDQALPADHYVEVRTPISTNSRQVGPAIRINPAAATAYFFGTQTGTVEIFKGTGGSRTLLQTLNAIYGAGDRLKLQAVGTTLTFFVNDVSQWTDTDTDYQSDTYAGWCSYRSRAAGYDNWNAGPAP